MPVAVAEQPTKSQLTTMPLNCFKAGQRKYDDGTVVLDMAIGQHQFRLAVDEDGEAKLEGYRGREPGECEDELKHWADSGDGHRNKPKTIEHTSRWDVAGQWVRSLSSPSALSRFLRAVGSRKRLGPVALPVLEFRHGCCHGTTTGGLQVSEPCPARHETDHGVFCKTCGCPEWKMADIRVDVEHPEKSKLSCPDLDCPQGRWASVK